MDIHSNVPPPPLGVGEEPETRRTQYDSVKMRYFLSLGMNKPPQMASSVPTLSSSSQLKPIIKRPRTKTSPSKRQIKLEDDDETRKRAISTPIPIGMQPSTGVAVPIPTNGSRRGSSLASDEGSEEIEESEEEEEESEEGEESQSFLSVSPEHGQFIPPHEMLKQGHSDFEVGTAQSVAVWEQRRRQYI